MTFNFSSQVYSEQAKISNNRRNIHVLTTTKGFHSKNQRVNDKDNSHLWSLLVNAQINKFSTLRYNLKPAERH